MATILELSAVKAFYGQSEVLHGIDLTVEEGGMTVLLGANGAGKTTTLRAICAMVRTEGQIVFAGRPLQRCTTEQVAGLGIAHVPEGRGTFIGLTVEENLRLGAYTATGRPQGNMEVMYGFFPILAQRRRQQAGALSGGEQQMLAIARAMMLEPKIILLDEPTEGLMPRMVSQIREIIDVLHRAGVAILLVEQNVPLTLQASGRVYIMEKGVVRHHAAASDLNVDDAVIHQYLGV